MATRNILQNGEDTLNKVSREVTDFNQRLHILLDDMRETMYEANGLGLAAPQIGVLRRVALILNANDEPDHSDEDDESEDNDFDDECELSDEEAKELFNNNVIELINPQISKSIGEQTGREGCLSVPGVHGIVTRPETVIVKAQDRHGNSFEIEVSELTARAACHEIDHLNGVIFTTIADKILTEEELAEMS